MNGLGTGDTFSIVAYPFLAVYLLARLLAGPADSNRWPEVLRGYRTPPAAAIVLFASGERTKSTLWGYLLQGGNFAVLAVGIVVRALGAELPFLPFAAAYLALTVLCVAGYSMEHWLWRRKGDQPGKS